ncbi:4026_t:CDS:10 [Scutellospora calospora]|uniref:4026_t:CDS:1 n=1 Tax=Scutellospora calospora TaxID=85575 RepID=A0ACA9KKH4_9GLOM|nr:4026_t:CDS:10 [Scutellospora calospora]
MADVNFALTDPSKKGFWRRHTSTLPGGVKPVESKTGATRLVIGAQYSYGEMSAANTVEVIGNAQTHSSNQATRDSLNKDPSSDPSVNFSSFISQPKKEKVPELFSTQSISVEKNVGIKAEIAGLVQDPMNSINSLKLPVTNTNQNPRINKFKDVLQSPNVDLTVLRQLSWKGIPDELRPMAWQLLLGYLPCNSDRRVATLARKRKEYEDSVSQAYARGVAGLDQTIWHQIHIDVPRTNPGIALYQYETTQQSLERILYVWAIRHPASGYVQGINDLVTPFFQVFLSAYIGCVRFSFCEETCFLVLVYCLTEFGGALIIDNDPEIYDPSLLPKEVLNVIEADSFWCLSKLLDGIQDNYTFAQPGIQRQISTLKDLINRIDEPLATHLREEGLEFIQFAFRWMNCLLMREMSLKNTIRMWDTYLAEDSDGFSEFHLYVCAAFLVKWSDKIRSMDFQGIMMFLQSLPTSNWNYEDIELLLSEAYMWKSLFHNAPNHLSRA